MNEHDIKSEIINTCIVNALRLDEESRMLIVEKITQNVSEENRKKLFSLFNVSQAEGEPCQIHSTDTWGKCFKCGEQVFSKGYDGNGG